MDCDENFLSKDLGDRLATLQLHRSLLEKDVQRLRTKLKRETDLRNALETALGFGDEISHLDGYKHSLPAEVRELVSDVASAKSVVSDLEDKVSVLRHEIGSVRAHRTRIILANSDDGDMSVESLHTRVEELKIKVRDIEVLSSDFQDRQAPASSSRNRIKPEQTFLGLPLGSGKKTAIYKQRNEQAGLPKRTSLDDTAVEKKKKQQQKTRTTSLFTGKLYSSVDVPNASSLLGRFKPRRKPLP